MSHLKVVFTALISCIANLLASPALCLRSSTLIVALRKINWQGKTPLKFKALKCLHYVYMMGFVLRTAALNLYLLQDGNLQDYLPFDPLFTILVIKYPFFNKYTTATVGLLSIFAAYIDYSIFFENTLQTTDILVEVYIENVRQCSATDFKSLEAFPLLSRRLWKALRQISQERNSIIFQKRHLKIFPHLSRKLRIDLLLVVIASEVVVWANNLTIGKLD